MRQLRTIPWLFVAALALAACGSATPAATDPAATEPAVGATADLGSVDPEPSDSPKPTEGGGGGGGGGSVPAIADGQYTSGSGHVEVTGEKSLSADLDLAVGASITVQGTTSLLYAATDGATSLQLVIDPESGPGVSLTSETLFAAGGSDEGCRLTIDKSDASGISGSLACPGLAAMAGGGAEQPKVDLNVTFTANR